MMAAASWLRARNAEAFFSQRTFNLPDPIPTFSLPLRSPDTEPVIDLHSLLSQVYERAGYEVAINYHCDPVIPLDAAAASWMNVLLQDKGLR